MAWSACRSGSPSGINPSANQHLRVALGASPTTLDPHRATGTPEEVVVASLFAGLAEYDPQTAAPIPELAESWEPSPDATTYTFSLRRGAHWSNGDPVTAHDFVYSWRRILDPQTASEFAFILYPIKNAVGFNQGLTRLRNRQTGEFLKDESGNDLAVHPTASQFDSKKWKPIPITAGDVGVEALDDYRLRVTMQNPTSYFMNLIPHWAFRPVHRSTVEQWGQEWTKPEHLVCNGPFTLLEWRPADKLVLKKNPAYWDVTRSKLEQVTLYLAEDTNALLNLYQVGELDTMVSGLLPVQQLPLLREKQDYVSGPLLSLYYYMLNTTRPPLNNQDVRRALNLALNRQQICDRVLQGGQTPATHLTPSEFGGRYPRPPGIPFNPAQAQHLMRQAGYPQGRGLRLRLTFSSLDIHRQIAEAIQAQWRDQFPEIQIELINLEWQVFQEARRQKDFDLALRHWTADYNDPYAFLELMLSSNSGNYTGWNNPAYDQLIHQANATVDVAERFKKMAEAERLVLEKVPFIPIYEGVTFFLTKPYVHGWHTNILDKHPLKFVWIEP